jgi:hypothetical protein
MARAAAACPPDRSRPLPTVNFLLDDTTTAAAAVADGTPARAHLSLARMRSPHSWCHADHITSWSERGPTNSDNGTPLCPRRNYLKELGFTIYRDDHGHWHITAPDGTHIC